MRNCLLAVILVVTGAATFAQGGQPSTATTNPATASAPATMSERQLLNAEWSRLLGELHQLQRERGLKDETPMPYGVPSDNELRDMISRVKGEIEKLKKGSGTRP